MNRVAALFLALAALTVSTATQAADKALLIELPNQVFPSGVSSDLTVVGGLGEGGGFHWMPTSGVVFIGGRQALSTSRDGNTIVGEALDARGLQQAAIWLRGTEWQLLGSIPPNAQPCDADLSIAIQVSGDGKVVVGLGWDACSVARAFRWEESTGMVNLGSTVAGRGSRADAVSGDGKVVVGFQDLTSGFRQGARWVDGQQTLFTGPLGFVGQAWDTNGDGSIVVGQVCRPGDPGIKAGGCGPSKTACSVCLSRGSGPRSRAASSGAPWRPATTAVSLAEAIPSAWRARPSSGWTSSPST